MAQARHLMRQAFRQLGIRPTSDQRAIKRAYAVRLKQTRPEDDPAGFQALQQAYQQALNWARAQPAQPDAPAEPVLLWVQQEQPTAIALLDATTETSAAPLPLPPEPLGEAAAVLPQVLILPAEPPATTPSASVSPSEPVPVPVPLVIALPAEPAPLPATPLLQVVDPPAVASPPRFKLLPVAAPADPQTLTRELLERLWLPELGQWLEAQLLDLKLRQAVSARLVPALEALEQLPAPTVMEELAQFFGWEHLSAPRDVRRVLARGAAAHALAEEAAIRFAYDQGQAQTRSLAQLLTAPFTRWRHIWWALRPSQVKLLEARMSRLELDSERQLERIVDPRVLAFWRQYHGNGPLNRLRVMVMAIRALLLAIIPALLGMAELSKDATLPVPLLLPLSLLVWAGVFLSAQLAYVGAGQARQFVLRRVHYWRSPRCDLLLAAYGLLLTLCVLLMEPGALAFLLSLGCWLLLLVVGGKQRWPAAAASGWLWLLVLPHGDTGAMLAPALGLWSTLAIDRLLTRMTRLQIEEIYTSFWLAWLAPALPLLLLVSQLSGWR